MTSALHAVLVVQGVRRLDAATRSMRRRRRG